MSEEIMRFYEIDEAFIHLELLCELLCEDGEIVRMKKEHGRFVHLDDNIPYGGKVYYFKKGPSRYFSVDANAFDEFKKSKKL